MFETYVFGTTPHSKSVGTSLLKNMHVMDTKNMLKIVGSILFKSLIKIFQKIKKISNLKPTPVWASSKFGQSGSC